MSVVRDLTLKQRDGERELYKEAAKRNLARTQEQCVQNMAYKVVGRRGSKREIFAPLRQGEDINSAGEVVWREEESVGIMGRGRGEQVTTYPNCVPVGRAGGTWGRSQDTPLDPIQAREREGGRGRGGRSFTDNWAQLQGEMERYSSGRRGGGLKRPAERDVRTVVRKGGEGQTSRSPPIKKAFNKASLNSSSISNRASAGPTSNHNKDTGLNAEEGLDVVREEEEDSEEEESDSQGRHDLDLEGAELIRGEGVEVV